MRYSTVISYDRLGRRIAIATTSGGVTSRTNYGWCGQALCQARTANDTPTRRYLAEGEYDAVQGGLVYGVDHLGAVRDVTSASTGQRTNHFDDDRYGNATAATDSRLTWADFRYAGLFYHQVSGLYLATHRAYDPTIGRWLSRDPIGEQGGIDLYGYGEGNPLGYMDRLGLIWMPAEVDLRSQACLMLPIRQVQRAGTTGILRVIARMHPHVRQQPGHQSCRHQIRRLHLRIRRLVGKNAQMRWDRSIMRQSSQ